jgi:small subunit ribosomal protein S20
MKQSENERSRNRAFRSRLRVAIKEVRSETTKEEAAKKLKAATVIIDKAATRKIIHKKNADRNKSRLAQYVNGLG